ncbi:MAG: heavy metal translocating P-type ATPase [Pseudomonadota bacterium]
MLDDHSEVDAGGAALRSLGGCCGAPTPLGSTGLGSSAFGTDRALERWAKPAQDGLMRVDLLAPDMRCAACIATIEDGLRATAGVATARVNLSLRRVGVTFDPERLTVAGVVERLGRLGFDAKPFDAAAVDDFRSDKTGRELLSCLAVAGFAAANVMLLSVSVWAGAADATRDLMHWVSALIALPAIVYAGRPFYRSALAALSVGRLNMDVPISLAVILASSVSLFETAAHGQHAYFDAAVSLLFFLLIGRFLDHRVRGAARSAAAELAALSATSATVVRPDGSRAAVAVDAVGLGDVVEVAAGERAPVDGEVIEGRSDLDRSMVTGETRPEPIGAGDVVHAGMMNLTGPIRIRVTATEEDTLLAEIARLIEAAESRPTKHTRLADRAVRLYAPGVHIVAAVAFAGWMIATGDLRVSMMIAASLLIITCPCALGLAVPAVQAAAGAALFRRGVLMKDGAALEKLAEIDTVAFDKTGTLTLGRPRLVTTPEDGRARSAAKALALGSRHPLSRALAEGLADRPAAVVDIAERPGEGVEGLLDGRLVRLGSAAFCGADGGTGGAETAVWLRIGEAAPVRFTLEDTLRPDAAETVAALKARGLRVILLSGDRAEAAARAAAAVGIEDWSAEQRPEQKLAALEALKDAGRKVLMVGDGLNDAPALAAAWISMSPAEASDVSRTAAGLVFSGDRLEPVLYGYRVARSARARALENFALATLYNLIAIPIAAAGFATPLVAALAMSSSSIVVTLNALRVRRIAPETFGAEDRQDAGAATSVASSPCPGRRAQAAAQRLEEARA